MDPLKFLAEPIPVNGQALANSALTAFALMEPFYSLDRRSEHLVMVHVADRVVQQTDRYLEAMSKSVNAANDRCLFAQDAIAFCDFIAKGRHSVPELQEFLSSMLKVADHAHTVAKQTSDDLRNVRKALYEISRDIPELAKVAAEKHTSFTLPMPEILSQLQYAQADLEQLVQSVDCFVDWWMKMPTGLRGLKTLVPMMNFNHLRAKSVRDRWKAIDAQYDFYAQRMGMIEDFFPTICSKTTIVVAISSRSTVPSSPGSRSLSDRSQSDIQEDSISPSFKDNVRSHRHWNRSNRRNFPSRNRSDAPPIPSFVSNTAPNKTGWGSSLSTRYPFKLEDDVRPKLYSNLLSLIEAKILASEKSEAGKILPCFFDSLMSAVMLMKDLDVVWSLVRSRQYHDQLLCLLAELGLKDRQVLGKALSKDNLQISDALLGVLNSEKKAQVLQLKGDDAERFMVVMLNIMDLDSFRQSDTGANASTCHRLLIKLAEACSVLPSSLNIEGIEQVEREPSACGGFADIFRGSLCAKIVALKRLRLMQATADDRLKIQKMFFREALIWRQLRHPHVLPFLGVDVNTFPGSLCMVSPWLEEGTLLEHLEKIRSLKPNLNQILFEIAQGIEYLRSQNIVHGDIRGANVLIDDEWRPRLADFGLAVFAEATAGCAHSPSRRGSVRWMAPELHYPKAFGLGFQRTPASDIYAYACLCYEVYSGHSPFSEITCDVEVAMSVIQGTRPARPTAMSNEFWSLVGLCWSQQSTARPIIQEVIKSMETENCVVRHDPARGVNSCD